MSRWLSSVNNILNKLDGQVENVASNASTVPEVSSAATIDAILNKRGLSNVVEDDNDDDEEEEEDIDMKEEEDMNVDDEQEEEEEEVIFEEAMELNQEVETKKEEIFNEDTTSEDKTPKEEADLPAEALNEDADKVKKVENSNEDITSEEKPKLVAPSSSSSKGKEVKLIAPISSSSSKSKEVKSPAPVSSSSSKEIAEPKSIAASNKQPDHKKEIKKLRHTIIELNKDLELTETEMAALRNELERTGIRIEKDRVRYKEEKALLVQHHTEELSQIKVQHAEAVSKLTQQHNSQIETLMGQIQSLEEGRIKESGGYQQELSSALQREQEFTRKNFLLEEEKMTLQSHISMLESQNKALEGRLEQATQTANAAMDREKELEEKMDDMLTLHAKLINQRQVREVELERTIADLGAALVVARKSSEKVGDTTTPKKQNNEQALLEEIETLKAQFMIESQHCTTLKQEIQDLTNERTEEVAQSISKQRQADRKITDLNSTITKLQNQILDYKNTIKQQKESDLGTVESSHEHKKLTVQIQSLSDQILRQQMKLDLNSSEVSTLKSRLQVAVARAENAEHKLNMQLMEGGVSDIEQGYLSPHAPSSGASHRVVRRRKKGESIKSAFKLHHADKKVGNAIDVLDKFAMGAGKYLRYNAMARGVFILYLLFLHLWALFILVFHVHSFEKEHGDFGSLHDPRRGFLKNVTKLAKGN